mmetsp:Transcript_44425/g.117905  ORF Transcript_44425/g.117905 Transcript_44425/m.117905 type:complete len:209 (+) Transcript_44425:2178-2804(+)
MNTGNSLIDLTSPAGIQTTHTAMMTCRLKAALPTIVEGPSSPLCIPLLISSMTLSKISGALEPNAMSVKLATVGFQTLYVLKWSPSLTRTFFDVIFSIASMKTSAMNATPAKQYIKPKKIKTACTSWPHCLSQLPPIGKKMPPESPPAIWGTPPLQICGSSSAVIGGPATTLSQHHEHATRPRGAPGTVRAGAQAARDGAATDWASAA